MRPEHSVREPPLPDLLRIKDVAYRLSLSDTETRKLCDRGAFPLVRIGERAIRIPRVEFERYLGRLLLEHGWAYPGYGNGRR